MSVVLKDKTIQSISIVSAPGEDASFLNRAKGVIDRIIAAQSVEVDTVSGATFSSKGILAAVKNALTGQEDTSRAGIRIRIVRRRNLIGRNRYGIEN
ncbi:MAG: FMN-binding protein [Blautia sp.]